MSDVHVRSDSVDVEQIMKQIRTRIKEKRGSDYTDAELQQLASVKLEQFADPSHLRSDLLEQFRQRSNEPSTYHRHHGPRRWLLWLLHPLLKRIQKQLMSDLNLYFEIIHNLVVEVTRLGIETQNLKMRVESLSSRMDFDERRSKALEGTVQYRQDAPPPPQPRQRPQEPSRPSQWIPIPPPPLIQPATATPTAAPAPGGNGGVAAPPPSGTPGGGGGGRPNEQGRPDGRRRRRRRRRRPGNTLAESPQAAGGQAQNHNAPVNSAPESDADDGPDEDADGSDQ